MLCTHPTPLPPVQQTLLSEIGATPYQVRFVDDGRAYCVGKALIEHGNRYDDANANDWQNLRAIAAALSRYEDPRDPLKVSAGSQIVERVINSIKGRYPFIDLLQPQGELVAFLLAAFEPKLRLHWDKICWMLRGRRLEGRNEWGTQPGESRYIACSPLDHGDEELQAAFGDLYIRLKAPTRQEVAWEGTFAILRQATHESLSEVLRRNEHIPPERLQQIRVTMRKLLLSDKSGQLDGPTGRRRFYFCACAESVNC